MQLVACAEPDGPLEDAPESALLALVPDESVPDERTARSAGYWARDDRWYARVESASGAVRWFTLADDPSAVAGVGSKDAPLAIAGARRVTLVGRAGGARPVLVLSARPRVRRG